MNKHSGFSLIEILVVLVIMGLLTTVVVINVLPNQDRAMVEKVRADVRVISQAVETLQTLDLMRVYGINLTDYGNKFLQMVTFQGTRFLKMRVQVMRLKN